MRLTREIDTARTGSAWALLGRGESRFFRREKHLKGMNRRDVRGHRHDRDHPVAGARGAEVRCRVADNDGRASSRGFGSDGRIKIDEHDVTASQRADRICHCRVSPSPDAASHASSAGSVKASA